MSVYGIRNLPSAGIPAAGTGALDRAREQQRARIEQQPSQPATTTRTGAAQAPAQAAQGLPLQAPPGTDPELWSVLTGEERAFFAKVGAMGPLTYGRVLAAHQPPSTPIARGGRLDVKV